MIPYWITRRQTWGSSLSSAPRQTGSNMVYTRSFGAINAALGIFLGSEIKPLRQVAEADRGDTLLVPVPPITYNAPKKFPLFTHNSQNLKREIVWLGDASARGKHAQWPSSQIWRQAQSSNMGIGA